MKSINNTAVGQNTELVAIRFGELPLNSRIVNTTRRQFNRITFEPGIKLTIFARSSDKDENGKPYIVIGADRKFEYVSENDIAIDSSALTHEERLKMSSDEQRKKLSNILIPGQTK